MTRLLQGKLFLWCNVYECHSAIVKACVHEKEVALIFSAIKSRGHSLELDARCSLRQGVENISNTQLFVLWEASVLTAIYDPSKRAVLAPCALNRGGLSLKNSRIRQGTSRGEFVET